MPYGADLVRTHILYVHASDALCVYVVSVGVETMSNAGILADTSKSK